MALASGTLGSIVWNGTLCARTRSWDLNPAMDTIDTTTQGVAWEEFIAGLRNYSVSADLLWDMESAQQTAIQNALLTGASGSARFYVNVANYYDCGTVFPTSFDVSTEYDGVAEVSVDFQGSGPLSYV